MADQAPKNSTPVKPKLRMKDALGKYFMLPDMSIVQVITDSGREWRYALNLNTHRLIFKPNSGGSHGWAGLDPVPPEWNEVTLTWQLDVDPK